MKRIIVLILLVVSITLPVSASGNVFKLTSTSYPIEVNGEKFETNNPVLNYNGSTYMPLREISNATGANIDWDSINKKIIIKTNQSIPTTNFNSDIKMIKLYSKISDMYRRLALINDLIGNLNSMAITACDQILFANDDTYLNNAYHSCLNDDIKYRNDLISPTDLIIKEANDNNINVTDLNNALNLAYNALEYSKQIYINLNDYYTYNKSQSYFDEYSKNLENIRDISSQITTITTNGYFKYYNLIQYM